MGIGGNPDASRIAWMHRKEITFAAGRGNRRRAGEFCFRGRRRRRPRQAEDYLKKEPG